MTAHWKICTPFVNVNVLPLSDAFMIVENICCQGSVLGYEFYFRSKVHRQNLCAKFE